MKPDLKEKVMGVFRKHRFVGKRKVFMMVYMKLIDKKSENPLGRLKEGVIREVAKYL